MVKTYKTISYLTWEAFKMDVTRDICGESFSLEENIYLEDKE